MKDFKLGYAAALAQEQVSVPYLLLQRYTELGLTETEMMLLIHLMAFKERELNEFPSIDELNERMQARPETVIHALERLMKRKLLSIDEVIEPKDGIQSEKYNLSAVYYQLAEWTAEAGTVLDRAASESAAAVEPATFANVQKDIFTMFEKEFARPLSPMECETISSWLDQDRYPEPLIREALKEAVFAGKIHFRYIDRILMDWSRNKIQTVADAKQFAKQFRGGK